VTLSDRSRIDREGGKREIESEKKNEREEIEK
jgi:hypothetical protein